MTLDLSRDFPAFEGRPVTQAHEDYCTEHGHATLQGVSPFCHRCGAVVKPDDRAVAIARQIVGVAKADPLLSHLFNMVEAITTARRSIIDGDTDDVIASAAEIVAMAHTFRDIAANQD